MSKPHFTYHPGPPPSPRVTDDAAASTAHKWDDAAVAQSGSALQHAAAELRADREVVLAAVAQNGHALKRAAKKLRADPNVRRLAGLPAADWEALLARPLEDVRAELAVGQLPEYTEQRSEAGEVALKSQ